MVADNTTVIFIQLMVGEQKSVVPKVTIPSDDFASIANEESMVRAASEQVSLTTSSLPTGDDELMAFLSEASNF